MPRQYSPPPRTAQSAKPPTSDGGAAPKLFLSATEFGEHFGIKRARAHQLIAAGLVPHVRLARRVFVPRRALDELAEVAIAAWKERGL